LLSEPALSTEKDNLEESIALQPRLYFSHNARTQQTTMMTTGLNKMHLSMIQHLKQLSGTSIQPEEFTQLLIKCFAAIQECFTATAVRWDAYANNPVYYAMSLITLY
jgi:hypothetical protein